MRTPHSATKRQPRGAWYWFIDRSRSTGWLLARKCLETGHPFDSENFDRGNYYASDDDAHEGIREYELMLMARRRDKAAMAMARMKDYE